MWEKQYQAQYLYTTVGEKYTIFLVQNAVPEQHRVGGLDIEIYCSQFQQLEA